MSSRPLLIFELTEARQAGISDGKNRPTIRQTTWLNRAGVAVAYAFQS